MKLKNVLTAIVLFTVIVSGCKKSASYHDILYFTGTEQTPETKLTLDGPGSIGVSVSSSTKVDKDVTISIAAQPDLVAEYNQITGKSYIALPAGSYTLSSGSVVMKSGSNVSASANFSVTSLAGFSEGATYCMPITITNVDNGMDILAPSKTIYVLINKTIITQAVNLSANYFTVPSFATDANLTAIGAITMECRVYVNAFQTKNPFISSVMGIEENFLLRFGDVSVANNQLQLAGGLVGTSKYPVTSNTAFSAGQWYHIAAIYNGSSVTLYVNGKFDSSTQAQNGTITFTGTSGTYLGGFHIGYSADGRLLNGNVSEARVWTRALTAIELQNNLCYVDPTSKGLLAYWRFNGDTNGSVTDLTGHGYTAVANKAVTYVQGVRCPK
jgi:hypothetical protein